MELPGRKRPKLLIERLNEENDRETTRLESAKSWLGIASRQIETAQLYLSGEDKAKAVSKWTRVAGAAIIRIQNSGKK